MKIRGDKNVGDPFRSIHALPQAIDIIAFTARDRDSIIEKCAKLRAEGLSYASIGRELAIAKSSVIGHLKIYQKTKNLRPKLTAKSAECNFRLTGKAAPYGFVYIRNKAVMDPREQEVIRKINKLWKAEKNMSAIAGHLNKLKISTRYGKKWQQDGISRILKRLLGEDFRAVKGRS